MPKVIPTAEMCIYCALRGIRFLAMTRAQVALSTAIAGFVDTLQEPRTPYISPKRFSQALGVKVANLRRHGTHW